MNPLAFLVLAGIAGAAPALPPGVRLDTAWTGPAPQIEVRVATTSAQLAKPFEILAAAPLPEGTSLELDLQRSTTDSFYVEKADDLGADQTPEAKTQGIKVTILPLALGKLSVNLYWRVDSASTTAAVEKPSTIVLDVTGPALQKDAAPIDIKEPRTASPALWPWILAALIGAALWELYRRRKAVAGLAAPPIPVDDRPAEVIAFSELDALESSGLWPQGKFKEFYFTLTEVMRQYLERRYGMPATRLTTSELYREMRQVELDRPLTALFKDILDRADLVKFAKIAPETDWGGKDVVGARSFIAQTTPKDMTPAAKEAKS